MAIDYAALSERYLIREACFTRPLNPAELKIDLLCQGIRINPTCHLTEDSRPLVRTRAGLGSGLEMILPGSRRNLWVNAPVTEKWVHRTPYALIYMGDEYHVFDERHNFLYPVRIPEKPEWYERSTSRGIRMSRIGTLQGTCLSIYIGPRCRFWTLKEPLNCKFCTSGLNVGADDEEEKSVDDVVETALAAQTESKVTFVHLNGGYQGLGGLKNVLPYLEVLKRRVGVLVGLQFTPEEDHALYDEAIDLGADHFSFCFEFYDQDYFRRYLPGKTRVFGQDLFLRSMEYCAKKMGRGKVSGEIVAGVEPIESTIRAIDYIADSGAFPFVCIFRPLSGASMEDYPPPKYEEMLCVFRHVYQTCRAHFLPIGIAPNINVSLSLQPDDTLDLGNGNPAEYLYAGYLAVLRFLLGPYFSRRMRRRA